MSRTACCVSDQSITADLQRAGRPRNVTASAGRRQTRDPFRGGVRNAGKLRRRRGAAALSSCERPRAPEPPMPLIPRFAAYAAAFEKSYASDDWSEVEPF